MALRPHKIKYWLNSPEKAESKETFNEKVNEICDLYLNAIELKQAGVHVISTDEMTGIQALEHKYEAKLPIPGRDKKIEFEYIRHGTTSMIGFFDVATGKVHSPYLNQTRNEVDFGQSVAEIVATDPNATFIFICDGLNTHKSETLVKLVSKACGLNIELGEKGKSGILKNMKSRTEFLHDPSHRIRFVYTPRHCSWMNQIEIWFGIISRKLLKYSSYTSVDKLQISIKKFVEQYNLTACPFKWTYTWVPLTA